MPVPLPVLADKQAFADYLGVTLECVTLWLEKDYAPDEIVKKWEALERARLLLKDAKAR
jgi:hypothetical protein